VFFEHMLDWGVSGLRTQPCELRVCLDCFLALM
jgi:hypothetical protein